MSQLAIQKYLNDLSDLKEVSGTARESVVREAFKDLLKGMGRSHDLVFIPEHLIVTPTGSKIYVDGALVYDLRLPFGYWEAKDQEDDLDKEIEKKFAKGYPQDNILFEDSHKAVLIQNKQEVLRCSVTDTDKLADLLKRFFAYQRPEILLFRKAVAQFQKDLPDVLKALREMIETAQASNIPFREGAITFLKQAQESINPAITAEDVREMLIQHILTEEIFSKVFDEDDFHRQNNVAKELYALEELFFTGALKKNTLKGLDPYYNAIRATAHQISTHNERQKFLKVIYEGFYKIYNKKAADRLGVVYTPQEIVRFMIESADWLCQKHFGKALIDKGVEILDPATGTGTFICELLEHFRGQPQKLAYKYKEELFANEVAILPYYVANLNIEATYAAITGQYAEFPNLCFVDTLDNVAALQTQKGASTTYGDLFGSISAENVERINRQNQRKISVIIGNPPYNANQQNENDNNKNRTYPRIDERIKATYIKESTAQKTKAYDMYTRFFRWASDRLKDDGIVAFITNRSFIDSRTMDGFRRCAVRDFSEVWIVDLGGDWKRKGKAGGGNVFGIGTGVAISFFVKKQSVEERKLNYASVPSTIDGKEKLDFLGTAQIDKIKVEELSPKPNGDWFRDEVIGYQELISVADKKTKLAKTTSGERSIFKTYSLGVVTARDDWVYDYSVDDLKIKIKYIIEKYNLDRNRLEKIKDRANIKNDLNYNIKWSRKVVAELNKGVEYKFLSNRIICSNYRPFTKLFLYRDESLNEFLYLTPKIFGNGEVKNKSITIMGDSTDKPYFCFAIDVIPDYNFVSPASGGTQPLPFVRYDTNGVAIDNITDWSLAQFQTHYGPQTEITKDAIFHYVYAVLHDPLYREKYAQNLKREFPRIPFYPDFPIWAAWGEKLMALHIGYETVAPWPLTRLDTPDAKARAAGVRPRPILKSDPSTGTIALDSETVLAGAPASAWTYRLGNRSALDWILDQHKEKTPKDPTIREKFNTYRFADYKEKVVDLLARVTRVSVETMEIVEAMRTAPRDQT